jgi:beta-N-acetylhexosaminidase
MTIGPVMLDLEGPELNPGEREQLLHPAVGGVILFARNYQEPDQVARLIAQLRNLRDPPLLVAVDQEGGRVQRFQQGFTRLPPAGRLGRLYRRHPEQARETAELAGWLMATELRSVGVDFSFAPVLDLDLGLSEVIGDRGFAADPAVVSELALAWMRGCHAAGMAVVGKHFPGHGQVRADSHRELPADPRPLEAMLARDLVPFQRLIEAGLDAIMPAHVVFPAVAPQPAGFSRHWLADVLRQRLGFGGVIFSDDLTMAAAQIAGNHGERARAAVNAGCDMVLSCNDPAGAWAVLAALETHRDPAATQRLAAMFGRGQWDRATLPRQPRWQRAVAALAELPGEPSA